MVSPWTNVGKKEILEQLKIGEIILKSSNTKLMSFNYN